MAGVSVNLSGNFSKLDELKSKANSTSSSIKKAFGSNIGKAAFAGMAAAATAAFATVTAATISAIKAGGELSDMMARTGADGEKLFVMQRAFENAGLAAAQVPAVLNKMQKALAGVNEEGDRVTTRVFNDLNLSLSELQGMDPADAFRAISTAIAMVPDPAKRAALGMEIFGKSAGQLLVLMDDASAFETAATQVGGLGATLSENATELDAVADSMGLFQIKLQQMGAEVAVALLPHLLELSDWLNKADFASAGQGAGMLMDRLAGVADVMERIYNSPLGAANRGLGEFLAGGEISADEAKRSFEEYQKKQQQDPLYMRSMVDVEAEQNMEVEKAKTAADLREQEALARKSASEAERAAAAAVKKAEADKKSAEATAAKRAEGLEEYKLEAAIINARIAGDEAALAAAEKEKRIREEILKLESQGFTREEARQGATQKVNAEVRATAAEKKKADEDFLKSLGNPLADGTAMLGGKDAMAKREQEKRAAELEAQGVDPGMAAKISANEASLATIGELQGKRDSLGFQSTIGTVSSMQRVGGGGGAVSSGLDYQRQAVDLNRLIVEQLRIIASRTPLPPLDF